MIDENFYADLRTIRPGQYINISGKERLVIDIEDVGDDECFIYTDDFRVYRVKRKDITDRGTMFIHPF